MATLPSGLPERVADDENLSRFLTQSNLYTAVKETPGTWMAKPAAFMPNPKHRNTSVFRMGIDLEHAKKTWNENATGERTLKAIAFCTALDVRNAQLDVVASEPPSGHANIEGWSWLESDPELQRARQKELAAQIASETSVLII
jgi:hypothetical protein